MQNILERNGTQTYFSWVACWHNISNIFPLSFQFHFQFIIDIWCTQAEQNLKSRTLKDHKVWFRNWEIPDNFCFNIFLFDVQTAISINTPDTFKKQSLLPPQ